MLFLRELRALCGFIPFANELTFRDQCNRLSPEATIASSDRGTESLR